MKVGVLALQGAFIEHANTLKKLGVEPILIKNTQDLKDIKEEKVLQLENS